MFTLDPELLKYATPDELAQIERALEIENAASSPLALAVYASDAEEYAHIAYINMILMAMFEHRLYKSGVGPVGVKVAPRKWVHPVTGEKALTQVAIKCPPRHGKSFLVSHHLPAWFLIHYPKQRVILASYEADFAAEWGEKVRNLIEEHPEFGLEVDKEARAKANWRLKGTSGAGGMTTAGAGGPITGKGGGLLIIDDPIKNAEEAMSAVDRENKDHWYQSVFRTRGNNKGDIIHYKVMMFTPWHEDDLGGRVLAREGEDWYELVLPALAYETTDENGISIDPDNGTPDALGRHPGEALCPDLATAEEHLAQEAGGKQWFAAMYQCKPNIQGGGIFRRDAFRRYRKIDGSYELHMENEIRHVPESEIMFRYGIADMAATQKTRADYSAVGVFAVTRNQQLILEQVYRRKLESPDHESFVREIYVKHKLRFLGVEDQTYGKSLIQHLIRGGHIVVRKLKADTDKVSRAIPVGDVVNNGQVFIPMDAEWVEAFLDEMVKFPNAAHDDQVDMFSYGVREWEKVPAYRDTLFPDTSMEARVRRRIDEMGKKKHRRHIDLG